MTRLGNESRLVMSCSQWSRWVFSFLYIVLNGIEVVSMDNIAPYLNATATPQTPIIEERRNINN